MDIKKRDKIIINLLAILVIIVVFIIINRNIDLTLKEKISLISDGLSYCYGVDSFKEEGDCLSLMGWFVELKSVKKNVLTVSDTDAELKLALVPLEEAKIGNRPENVVFLDVLTMKEKREDVNEYLKCEYDYSKSGFTATIAVKDISLETTNYRLAIKPDAMKADAILTNVYLTEKGIEYTNPTQSPELDTEGTDLDRIVKTGVRLVSRPDCGCYVYQLDDKLYWITDEDYVFCDDGKTFIQYQMDTTQIERLPMERLNNNWFWSNIGGYFEDYEITQQMNCGKYRVSVRNIPRDYSITSISTGYIGEWEWLESFKPCYAFLL